MTVVILGNFKLLLLLHQLLLNSLLVFSGPVVSCQQLQVGQRRRDASAGLRNMATPGRDML